MLNAEILVSRYVHTFSLYPLLIYLIFLMWHTTHTTGSTRYRQTATSRSNILRRTRVDRWECWRHSRGIIRVYTRTVSARYERAMMKQVKSRFWFDEAVHDRNFSIDGSRGVESLTSRDHCLEPRLSNGFCPEKKIYRLREIDRLWLK